MMKKMQLENNELASSVKSILAKFCEGHDESKMVGTPPTLLTVVVSSVGKTAKAGDLGREPEKPGKCFYEYLGGNPNLEISAMAGSTKN